MANKELSYAKAMAQIEDIVRAMNENELDVDSLGAQVERATELISLCKEKLHKAQQQVDAILNDDKSTKR